MKKTRSRVGHGRLRSMLFVCGIAAPLALAWGAALPQPRGAPAEEEAQSSGTFHPVPLPDPKIPGFTFPEAEKTILGWVSNDDQDAISSHAWGIWTALTSPSGQTYEGQDLLVFETWDTPGDLLDQTSGVAEAVRRRNPRPLNRLRQFHRDPAAALGASGEGTVTGFVKYDPTAAEHIVQNKLLSINQLNTYLANGDTEIPTFPNAAISVKPVFQTISQSSLVDGRYYMLANWPGSPDPAIPFPPSAWKQCVWVDTQAQGAGPGTGKVDTVCNPNGASRTPETTYGVDRFIHFTLSTTQAMVLNAVHDALPGLRASRVTQGDIAILVGMHVTSREVTRWTWQTFWWSPDPDNPPVPSSPAFAATRPAQLKGAPRNYAVALAYSMVNPPQPNTGGKNVGNSVYGFNPWLEAGFGTRNDRSRCRNRELTTG